MIFVGLSRLLTRHYRSRYSKNIPQTDPKLAPTMAGSVARSEKPQAEPKLEPAPAPVPAPAPAPDQSKPEPALEPELEQPVIGVAEPRTVTSVAGSVARGEKPQAEPQPVAASAASSLALAVGEGDPVQVFSASAKCWLDGVVEQVDHETAEAEIRYSSAGADRLKWISLRDPEEVRAAEPPVDGSALSTGRRGAAGAKITAVPLARAPLSQLPTASTVSLSPARQRRNISVVAAASGTPTTHRSAMYSPHTPVVGGSATPGGKFDMGRAGLTKALAQLEIPNLAGLLASELGVQTLADMVHLETEDLADLAHHNVKAVQRRRLGRAIAFAKVCSQRTLLSDSTMLF